MKAESQRRIVARSLSIGVFLLGLGVQAGSAIAGFGTHETEPMAWPAGAMTAAGLFGFSFVWRGKKAATDNETPATESASTPKAHVAAPEPVRAPPAELELIQLEGPSIDHATLESLRALGGDDFVKEIMSQFISEGVLALFKVAQAINEGDCSEYGSQVHALRSSAANVGARRLYKLCLEWRELSRDELAQTGSARFVQLQREFSAAERALKERDDYTDRDMATVARAG